MVTVNRDADALLRFVPPMVVRRFQADPSFPTAPVLQRFSAAVMFADISGFTPLTEYLAQRGPDGAEQLTHLLNDYFGKLLAIISQHGGEVVKFAGDAMVAVWPSREGSRHALGLAAQLAVQCGLEAQAALHHYPVLEDRTLSLHVGIGAGDTMAFHVGGHSAHWEFTLAGPALEQMADAEHLSSPGTVVVSPEAWSLLRNQCTGDRLDSGFVQVTGVTSPVPAPVVTPLELDPPARPAVETYIPDAARTALHEGHGEWLAELRRVTVLFVNVRGLDYAAPDVLDRLQRVTHSLQSILFHYEACINQILVDDKGTVVVAALGLPPLGHEDDAVRGVNAAVALAARLRELELSSAIGVATGRVFCGPVGSAVRSTYTIMGDSVNVAARLMQAAPDDVLCESTTCQLAGARLRFDELPPISLKGKAEPLAVFRPHGETTMRQRLKPMFGRSRERAQLAASLAHLKEGKSSETLLIEAEAGMGKSRLVAELMEQARGTDVTCLFGAADAVERSTPYLPFRSIFRQVFNLDGLATPSEMREQVRARAESWFARDEAMLRLVPLLNEVLPIDMADNPHTAALTGRTRAENTQRLLIRVLQKAAAAEHLIVIVEDGHWLDSASWLLAHRVSTDVSPVLLVLAHRPLEDPPEAHRLLAAAPTSVRVQLEALAPEETLALISERLDVGSLPDEIAQFVLRRGGGSPFFSEELAYALRDSGNIAIENRTCRIRQPLTQVQVPQTVQGVITSRIDRLQPAQQLMLKSASVIGRVFSFRLLQDIYPVVPERTTLPDNMEELVRSHFVLMESPAPDLAYIFNHVITQEVAYQQMLVTQRRQLHRAIAEWFEQNEAANLDAWYPLLAHHWNKADEATRAREYLGKAGEQALRSGVYREACGFLEAALKRDCPDPVQRATLYRLLGEAFTGLGNLAEGEKALEEALRLLGMPIPIRTPLPGLLPETLRQCMHRVRPDALRAPAAERRTAHVEAVRVYERLMELHYLDEKQIATMFAAVRGLNMAEELGPCPELARFYANMCIAVALVPLHSAAEQYAWRAQVVARQVKQLEVTGWVWELIGMFTLGMGQLSRAEEHLVRSANTFEQLGDIRHWEESMCLMAERFLYQGYLTRSDELYARVLNTVNQTGDAEAMLWCYTVRGYALNIQGRDAETADGYYRQAEEILTHNRLGQLEQILYHSELAYHHLVHSHPGEALSSIRMVLPLVVGKPPTAMSSFEGRAALAETCVRLWELEKTRGARFDADDVPRMAMQASASLRRFAQVFPIAQARACTWSGLAAWLAGGHQRAFNYWRRSLSVAERMDLVLDQALAHREIGRHLPPDHVDRKAHLERADELFERCAADTYLSGSFKL
ncbi:MAG: adenylate/guanylate cyclase domain-containing protein [Candidatus Xenobia bacterium]